MSEFPDALIEQAAQAHANAGDDGCFDCEFCGGDPGPDDYCSCCEDRDYNRKLARAVLEAVAPAIRAQALRDAADAMSRRLGTFSQNGRHTRARWAEWFIREWADQIDPKEGT